MEADGNEKNNEKVKLKQELFTNLFSTSMFKLDQLVHTKIGEKTVIKGETVKVGEEVIELKEARCDVIIEKPIFSQDENGCFKFADGEEKDFAPYHSEDEFSFAEALDFLKEFSDKSLI